MDNLFILADKFVKMAQDLSEDFAQDFFFSQELAIELQDAFHYFGLKVEVEDIQQWLDNNKSILRIIKDWIPNTGENYIYFQDQQYSEVARLYFEKPTSIVNFMTDKIDFIKGYKSIPNSWLYSGDAYNKPYRNLSKKIAPDAFIVEALDKVLAVPPYSYSNYEKDIENFIQQNIGKINQIRSFFTIMPRYLGHGVDGVAFDIGGQQILKIFINEYSFQKAKEAQERLFNDPKMAKQEAMIYDVGILGEFAGKTIYYYIMEKFTPVRDADKVKSVDYSRALDIIISDIKTLIYQYMIINSIENLNDIKSRNLFSYVLTYIKKYRKNTIKMITDVYHLNNKWLPNLVEEIFVKVKTGREDLHTGNVGITKHKQLRIFDPSGIGP